MKLPRTPASSITVDDLAFDIRWSRRRRTIGISVAREGDLRVLVPVGVSTVKLETVVRAKLPWVRRKLAEFAAQGPPPAPKRFVDGERLPYLGRTYELVLVDRPGANSSGATERPLVLRHGRFELMRGPESDVRACVEGWYAAQAQAHITARVAHFVPLVGAEPAAVIVRNLGKRRWGSCDGGKRTLSFHWELIFQPPAVVDYVVVHELVHLHELNHASSFWLRVACVLPDCKERRAWLSAHGHRHVI